MGVVAEAALRHKGQHSLFSEPLQLGSVYKRLRRISSMSGRESKQRKIALLRGLFQEATPLEGKFIARTAMRNMLAGMGHKTMIAALSIALNCDQEKIRRAYSLMPDLGSIASLAQTRPQEIVAMRPCVPIKFMIFPEKDLEVPGAFLPKYPGLRVQVHKINDEILIFTSQLRNITSTLNGLCQKLQQIDADFIADADLIGFHDSGICSQAKMLRYINRRRLTRKSRLSPALLAYDLMALDGEDICGLTYRERRNRLVAMLGEPKAMPFSGISPACEEILTDRGSAEEYLSRSGKAGARALLKRDLQAAYRPNEVALRDFKMK
jgi:DNA ligase-1